ncbi:hypothetical protein M422DRAFT_268134, partial [Sphaerobolus stellatus SS14]
MREKFYESSQGKRPIRDYIRHLRSLASRVPELNDFSIVQQLVKSAAPYLQIKWAEAGFSQDFTSLHEYEESGYRFEQAEQEQAQRMFRARFNNTHPTTRREDYPRPQSSSQFRNNYHGQPKNNSMNHRPGSPNFKQYSSQENPRVRHRDRSHPNRPYHNAGQSAPRLSPQERDVLRANNQCFNCKEKGHLVKDCPQRNSVRHPGIQASAARIVETARQLDSMDTIDLLHSNAANISNLSHMGKVGNNFDAFLIAQSEWDIIAQTLGFFRPSVVSDLPAGTELRPHYVITPYNAHTIHVVDIIYNFVYYLPYGIITGPIELLSEQIDFEEEIRADMIPSLPVPYVEYFWIDASIEHKFNIIEDPLNNPLRLTEQHLRIQEIYVMAQKRRQEEQEAYSPFPPY